MQIDFNVGNSNCRRNDFDVCESTKVMSAKRPRCMWIDLYANWLVCETTDILLFLRVTQAEKQWKLWRFLFLILKCVMLKLVSVWPVTCVGVLHSTRLIGIWFISIYTIIKLMHTLWLVNQLLLIVPVNPWKFRVSSELLLTQSHSKNS